MSQALKSPGPFRFPFRHFAQIACSAQKTGFGFRSRFGFLGFWSDAEAGEQFGHSLTNEMVQNRRFFKAGAGGGEV